ncbi:hypothetical protein H5410_007926 [Solanum commersonii]|uniref:Uncharacterized protein n=1 Tax=Solanum commersonii TaxID=4109 RepID=A0A9J6AEJ8_SOLCO|nr:hypothetical protein H5410_007926 [Solanum commersonii]
MSLKVKGPVDMYLNWLVYYVTIVWYLHRVFLFNEIVSGQLDFEKLKLQSPEADAAVEARKKNVEDAGKD